MVIICILQVFISWIAIISMKKTVYKWIIVFNVWWLLLLISSYIIPYGGYSISENACICFGLFLFFTSIGYIFTKPVRETVIRNNEISIEKEFDNIIVKNRVVRIIVILLTLALIYYAIKYSAYMSVNSILNARLARFYVGYVFNSTFELLFFNYIISTGRFLFIFIISFGIIYGRIKNIPFVFSVLGLVLYSYIGGSRFPVVFLAISIIVLLVIKNEDKKIKRITGKNVLTFVLIIIGAAAIYFLLLYFTAYRLGMKGLDQSFLSSSTNVLYDQIVGYNIGPIASFSKMLDTGALYNHYYFGRGVLLNGIDELFTNILSVFNIPFSSARYEIGEIAATTITVGSSSFNALYTCVYWFFSDLGYFGVALYSFIFGSVQKKIVTNYYVKRNLWSLMLAVHCIYFLIMSNTTWEINTMDSLVYIFFIALYIRKKEYKLGYIQKRIV